MGMESYFFSLNMETILQPANILDFFQRRYKVRSYDTIRRKKTTVDRKRTFFFGQQSRHRNDQRAKEDTAYV